MHGHKKSYKDLNLKILTKWEVECWMEWEVEWEWG